MKTITTDVIFMTWIMGVVALIVQIIVSNRVAS